MSAPVFIFVVSLLVLILEALRRGSRWYYRRKFRQGRL